MRLWNVRRVRCHQGWRRRWSRRPASDTCCSPTSPATRASWPASSRSTASTSAAASPRPTACWRTSSTRSSRASSPTSRSSSSRATPSSPRRRPASLDGQGDRVLEELGTMYRVVHRQPHGGHPGQRPRLHRLPGGRPPRPQGGAPSGPRGPPDGRVRQRPARPGRDGRASAAQEHASATDRLPPYLFLTDAAATALGAAEAGLAHGEEYPDAGRIHGRVLELALIGSRPTRPA